MSEMAVSTFAAEEPDVRADNVEATAKARLLKSPYRAIRDLSCEYVSGVLVLKGRLLTFYQKQLAQEAVGGLVGVSRIDNKTEVSE